MRVSENENLLRLVDELELSVRSANNLMNADIVYVGELVQKTEAELIKSGHFGKPPFAKKVMKELKEILADMGLALGMRIEDWPGREALRR